MDDIKATIGEQAQRHVAYVLTGDWKDISDITTSELTGILHVQPDQQFVNNLDKHLRASD